MIITSGTLTIPSPHTKLYGLDHLRALAISFVFIYHYGHIFPAPEWLTSIGKFGWTGVDLFFVLSGYLISSQLFATIAKEKKISFKAFFLKRFFRIVPGYLVIVAIYFCFPASHEREALAPLWKYVTFTQNLGLDLRTQGTFSHAWSLCIEEQFYLLLPLILMALVYCKAIKKGLWLLTGLFLFGFTIRWYVYDTRVAPFLSIEGNWANWYKWIYYPTYSRLDGLLSGVGIAALFQFRPLLKEKLTAYGNLFLFLSVAILMGAYFVCINEESFISSVIGFALVSIGYGALVLGAISPTSFLYKFKSAITTKIATLSYAIYLSHKILIHITQEQFSKLDIEEDSGWMFLICIITCLAGAWLMNIIIEKPFLKLRNRILKTIKFQATG
jgi:peptidoglycan/LPS O-acetylase OafA/YrhL